MICPLLSKSGSEPSECQKDLCAWYIKGEKYKIVIRVQIALWMPAE